MQLHTLSPGKAISKTYLKSGIQKKQFELFREQFSRLYSRLDESESEENQKNLLSDLLKNSLYEGKYEINTKGRIDLVISHGTGLKDKPGVLIEVKRQSNRSEMITAGRPNCKALHELILYYMEERYKNDNLEIKHIIATNIHEWYIFDAVQFEKLIYKNKGFFKKYRDWADGLLGVPQTDWFYSELAKPFVETELESLTATHLVLKEYMTSTTTDEDLALLIKLLSPQNLLKQPHSNDSNILNKDFYFELLHILGLEERKENSKKIISRVADDSRLEGSLLENTINILKVRNRLALVPNSGQYGDTVEDQIFSVALELCITWLNRVLFLKLLEGQLLSYHRNDAEYRFLNETRIRDFDELNELFFEVLAVEYDQRSPGINEKYRNIPYLNSSLFEETELERMTITIAELKDRFTLPLYGKTVLKNADGSKLTGSLNVLEYLFKFLDSYDFSSEAKSIIQEANKTIINSSVLGLIFEKLNGYKEGSIFTPGFCTMYMSREAIRPAVLNKFNTKYGWGCSNFVELYNFVNRIPLAEANEVFRSFRICDPAVGSGHLLVSVLNELISIKSELNILCDKEGKILRGYEVVVENDELIVSYENEIFVYNYRNKESQRVQEALFHEKQTIIENSLFGVDINPKSVMICRLRLWIELLKNAYYTKESGFKHLETLPNIDINIKTGNSLISRFSLNDKYEKNYPDYKHKLKQAIENYKEQVVLYKSVHDKSLKREIENNITDLKSRFREMVNPSDKDYIALKQKENELLNPPLLYEEEDRKAWAIRLQQLIEEKDALQKKFDLKMKTLYGNSFEWRFEFPEVLDDEGSFVGFDIVIGNPPYIRQEMLANIKEYLKENYNVFESTADLLTYFIELAFDILKKEGVFQFIVANKFSRTRYGKTLRGFLAQNTTITHYLDFNDYPVFEEAVVLAAIVGFIKKTPGLENQFQHFKVDKDKFDKDIEGYLNSYGIIVDQKDLGDDPWSFENPLVMGIKNKVMKESVPLLEWNIRINYGLKTGFNDAFIIDGINKDELIAEDPKSGELLVKLVRGRDIQNHAADFQNLWLINSHNGYKTQNHDEVTRIDIERYPAIYRHLQSYDEQLKKRSDQGDTPYNLRDCAYLENFLKPKIIYPNMTKFLPFVFDDQGYFTNQKCFIMTGDHLYYLVAFFNSWLFKLCFRDNFPELIGGTRELSKVFFEKIPVKPISDEEEKPYKELVTQISTLKKADPLADISTQESELNRLIYEYYDISEEEQRFIEETVKGWME